MQLVDCKRSEPNPTWVDSFLKGLDDLCVRFIINLPREELESVERICFQVEEAQWFYEDFVRPLDPNLPSLNLRQFCLKIFQHCPLFSGYDTAAHSNAFSEFLAYKTRVPVRGAILLNETMTEVVLVKGWKKGANWSFPRGKINKDEEDIDCAVREVYEETGYDVRAAGLVREHEPRCIEVTMREQHMKLFVFTGVPMNTHFEPRTRKEISKIQWYKLSDLPTSKRVKQHHQEVQNTNGNSSKFYMVAPFINPLRKIIKQLRNGHEPSRLLDAPEVHPLQSTAANTDPVQSEADTGGLESLMAKLRDSKLAVENNGNDAKPALSEDSATSRIKALLQISESASSSQRARIEHNLTDRDGKALAILSMLQSKESGDGDRPAAWPEPAQSVHGTSEYPASAAKPLLPTRPPVTSTPRSIQSVEGAQNAVHSLPSLATSTSQLDASGPIEDAGTEEDKSKVRPTRQQLLVPTAPYHHTGDFSLSQSSQAPLVDRSVNAPAAGKLPPPRLNPHSSALLDLFKGSHSRSPAVPFSGASIPMNQGRLQTESLTQPTPPASALPSVALAANNKWHQAHEVKTLGSRPTASFERRPSPPSHQQALLQLFQHGSKAEDLPPRPPSRTPVELSAASPFDMRVHTDGRSKSSRLAPSPAASSQHRITIAKRPPSSDAAQRRDNAGDETNRSGPRVVKILPRPASGSSSTRLETQSPTTTVNVKSRKPNESGKGKTAGSALLANPRILKRPTPKLTQTANPNGEHTLTRGPSDAIAKQDLPGSVHTQAIAPTQQGGPHLAFTAAHEFLDFHASEPRRHGSPPKVRPGLLGDAAHAPAPAHKQQPPTESANPVDQNFLLGFLGEVARNGK